MGGRGSFIESFPLFGNNLNDYDALFEEKLDLLLNLQENEIVTSTGHFRPSIQDRGIYPRPVQEKLPIWVASGGTPQSAIRAATLGLPLTLAIIGGSPLYFARIVQLYYDVAKKQAMTFRSCVSLPIRMVLLRIQQNLLLSSFSRPQQQR